MNLLLYLDDDFYSHLRARLLRQAGFDVVVPAQIGTTGSPDSEHLRRSTELGRVLISHNVRDFHRLHTQLVAQDGHHAGIMLFHQNPPSSAAELVRRIALMDVMFEGLSPADSLLFPPRA